MHVTVRLRGGLPSLRQGHAFPALLRAFAAGRERLGLRLVHYSVQSNHLHLIVEADGREALGNGLQGLLIRVAKGLNKAWRRKGKVFLDRNHRRALRTPWEVRNALVYVLQNSHRHGIHQPGVDPYSSGPWFDGWRESIEAPSGKVVPVAPARTWLLRVGWRRHGAIGLDELPALR